MVRQAVIAGGGIGSRLSRGVNTLRSKQLIEYRGKTMIEHLIDGLKEGGVSEYLIGTAEHSHERINEIVRRLGIDVVCKVHKGAKFEMVPDHFSCDLDDRFLFVCGHQPISSEFVSESRVAMRNAQYVIAKYQNEAYPHKKDRENYIYSGDEVRIVEFGQNIDENNFLYLRNPYILDKDVVRECCKGGYVQSFGRLLVESSKRDRRSLATIEANFPPEFDYDDEYDRTKKYLDQKANEVSIPLMVFSSLGSSAVEE